MHRRPPLPDRARATPRIRLGPTLAPAVAREIRRVMELRHFKWDAQVGDVAVLAPFPLLVDSDEWRRLASLAEALYAETLAIEEALVARPSLQRRIGVPAALVRLFAFGRPTPAAARVMRVDFHPTADGWRISEVNSDVPGGFTEATHLAALMAAALPGARPAGDPTRALVDALAGAIGDDGVVALTSAAGHLEDHQVIAHLAAAMRARGLGTHVVSLPQLRFRDRRAHVGSARVDAVYRFYQAEWLARLPRHGGWPALFVDGDTPVVNPGTAVLSESKRAPLVWDALGVALPTWRRLLPETRALADAPWSSDDGWLLKSAYGNSGDTVFVRAAMTPLSWARRAWAARLQPSAWIAQRRFSVLPLHDDEGALHPCIGVYVVDGTAAGAYARLSRGAVVDFSAREAALLIYDGA